MREESCFGPLLQETSDSSSTPPPQRTINKARRRLRKAKEEGSESASAPTSSSTVSLRKPHYKLFLRRELGHPSRTGRQRPPTDLVP
ncbi:hypothetical protein SKAU_G00410120 [Synaphobranchus kaupii]|uniref:Uncharacterized protein n=1 Tax=Synaphobranchus kaupii TaxID=118154 RepID=A0A9Q1E7I9_SYNKA|nr:hypothetical protein SKAU_G00410120 [Synaphobranchus kaupii]